MRAEQKQSCRCIQKKVNEGSSQVCVNHLQVEFNQRGDPFLYFIQSVVETFWVLSNNKKHSHYTMFTIFASRKNLKFLNIFFDSFLLGYGVAVLSGVSQLQEKPLVYLVTRRRLVIQVSLGWMLWSVDSECCLIAVHCCSRGLKREVISDYVIPQGARTSFKF